MTKVTMFNQNELIASKRYQEDYGNWGKEKSGFKNEEELNNYYSSGGDLFNDVEYYMDPKNEIKINFAVDKENNEVLINWVKKKNDEMFDKNGSMHCLEDLSDIEYERFEKTMESFFSYLHGEETELEQATDHVGREKKGYKDKDLVKVLYRGGKGYTYGKWLFVMPESLQ